MCIIYERKVCTKHIGPQTRWNTSRSLGYFWNLTSPLQGFAICWHRRRISYCRTHMRLQRGALQGSTPYTPYETIWIAFHRHAISWTWVVSVTSYIHPREGRTYTKSADFQSHLEQNFAILVDIRCHHSRTIFSGFAVLRRSFVLLVSHWQLERTIFWGWTASRSSLQTHFETYRRSAVCSVFS